MEAIQELIERAKKQFATNQAPWDDARTPPAITNVVSPLIMDRDAATLTPAHVRIVRVLVKSAIADIERYQLIANADKGKGLREDLGNLLDALAGYYNPEGKPY